MHRKKILLVDDEKLLRWSIRQKLSEWDLEVSEAETGNEALKRYQQEIPDLVILDMNLPDMKGSEILSYIKADNPEIPVIIITAYGSIDDAVSAMQLGAYNFLTKPIDYLKLQNAINNAFEALSLKKEVALLKEKVKKSFHMRQIVAHSDSMRAILDMTRTIATSEASIVLLQGGSGTGKDLLAQAIHHLSRRSSNPYLAINCSAIPENLLESELFGYEKGAFTDAKQRKQGLVEMAHTGTLFLDEISTLSLPLQAKLLRFLETHTFRRVGGLQDIEVDIRVIAATNQDLDQISQSGDFRRDLFFRLNVFLILIPPLKDRIDDILPLTQHFIQEFNQKFRKNISGLTRKAERIFLDYSWPGNVRELKNALERAMIFEQGTRIGIEHLPILPSQVSQETQSATIPPYPDTSLSLEDMEKRLLVQALKEARGNKSQAARLLQITRDTLRYKLKKHNLP
jgi:DNA-binding NtrC family response regulator